MKTLNLMYWVVMIGLLLGGCSPAPEPVKPAPVENPAKMAMNEIATTYVSLVLAIGQHDDNYVDAYYGPEEWKKTAAAEKQSLEQVKASATALQVRLAGLSLVDLPPIFVLRHTYLSKQLVAMQGRVDYLSGVKHSFDQEASLLYDVTPPTHDAAYFDEALSELDKLLPGKGDLPERMAAYRKDFVIPQDKIDAVFKTAIAEARKRTLAQVELPQGESFEVEYVNDKPWSGYNWYKGKAHSLIQVNVDLPIYIDRALDLACHEGYPGHHVYNALLEKHLVDDLGWVEFSVYPLFSPQSLIAEGSANYGIRVAFPKPERLKFERDVLFPMVGIDPAKVENYYEVLELLGKLSYAGNEAARGFLNGTMTGEQAIAWLIRYNLSTPEAATQRLAFIERYRAYVINYNLGQDLVGEYVERRGGTEDQPEQRWKIFKELLSSPRLPSGLK